jgi:hypothetical protein
MREHHGLNKTSCTSSCVRVCIIPRVSNTGDQCEGWRSVCASLGR